MGVVCCSENGKNVIDVIHVIIYKRWSSTRGGEWVHIDTACSATTHMPALAHKIGKFSIAPDIPDITDH